MSHADKFCTKTNVADEQMLHPNKRCTRTNAAPKQMPHPNKCCTKTNTTPGLMSTAGGQRPGPAQLSASPSLAEYSLCSCSSSPPSAPWPERISVDQSDTTIFGKLRAPTTTHFRSMTTVQAQTGRLGLGVSNSEYQQQDWSSLSLDVETETRIFWIFMSGPELFGTQCQDWDSDNRI